MKTRNICVRAIVAAAILLSIHCGSEKVPQRPDILLITIDTLRADSLEPYGATETLTPNIARLASEAVVYEAATTPMPLTRPAHASILTGLYPDQHGVLTNRQILREEDVTLAEILLNAGYQTAGFTGIRFLNQRSGLAQGFADFAAPKDKTEKPLAKNVVERAIKWLGDADPEIPILLWVHAYDPHQPYDPPQKFRRGIDPALERRIPVIRWKALNRAARMNNGDVPSDVFELALDYYRGEVEYTDFWIGKLLENFDRLREPQRTMVILTSDHGECFENGNHFEHADCLYDGALRVPLIVRYPDGVGAGLRVGHRVSNLDITSTVLKELSLALPEGVAGLPLQEDSSEDSGRVVLVRAPEIRNPDRIPPRLRIIRSVVGEPVAPATDPRTRGIVDRFWKFLWTPDSEQLFRLPDERLNRATEEADLRARLLEALEAEMLRYPAGGVAPDDQDAETLEALEALGYVQ
jgi:arylsulfatase A-like enzyme